MGDKQERSITPFDFLTGSCHNNIFVTKSRPICLILITAYIKTLTQKERKNYDPQCQIS